MKIAVLALNEQTIARVRRISQRLQLPLLHEVNADFDGFLLVADDHLELRYLLDGKLQTFTVDFVKGPLAYRRVHGGGFRQQLARAVGVTANNKPFVIDATAGWGRDAFVLASLGCKVCMLERSAIVSALVSDGLQRLQATLAEPMVLELITADACTYLQTTYLQQPEVHRPDVIYLDPMFPARTKSALVKKDLRILAQLVVDADDDSEQLLKTALKTARKRVVVKRPRLANPLADRKPSFSLTGKVCRFDVFLIA